MTATALPRPATAFFRDRVTRTKWLRQAHIYLGVFIAPSLLLFALTGALQLFGLHEPRQGYQPAPIIEKLAQVHIHQAFAVRPKRPVSATPGRASGAAPAKQAERATPFSTSALKWLFLLISVGIVISTSLGLWFGLTRMQSRKIGLGVLLAGAALPVLILVVFASA